MAQGKFVAYHRVSTNRQGVSGLGLEAQKEAVRQYLNGGQWTLVGEFTEVESGKRNDRPKLAESLRLCRIQGATLVVAKLDRLSRDAAFLLNLQAAGVRFVAVDMPEANELTVGIMAVVAQAERKMISARTKAALAASTKKLGGDRGNFAKIAEAGRAAGRAVVKAKAQSRAVDYLEIIRDVQAGGAVSLREIAAGLNARGIGTAKGGEWSAVQVRRVLERAA
ncbi:MAG TPA: recombinase family protein [Microvirga sp.]|jgi:DNA invertase Pin-like site-specific DNA recombinase|nr:recombinase family protein [Microvirga sp.]